MVIGLDTLAAALTLGALYAIVTAGLTMVYGMMRILHIAHAAVLVLGAYFGYFAFQSVDSFWIALPVGIISGGILNYVIFLVVFQRVLDTEPLVPLILSIGLFVALSDSYRIAFGPDSRDYTQDFGFSSPISWMTVDQFVVITVTIVLLGITYALINRTKIGLAWQVTAQDRETAASMGINVNRIYAMNFLIAGALAGAAGTLVGIYSGSVDPYMGGIWSYKMFIIIVVGGLGSLGGTVFAGVVLGLYETIMIATAGYLLPRDALAFSLMILVLMFKPEGLMGGDSSWLSDTFERVAQPVQKAVTGVLR